MEPTRRYFTTSSSKVTHHLLDSYCLTRSGSGYASGTSSPRHTHNESVSRSKSRDFHNDNALKQADAPNSFAKSSSCIVSTSLFETPLLPLPSYCKETKDATDSEEHTFKLTAKRPATSPVKSTSNNILPFNPAPLTYPEASKECAPGNSEPSDTVISQSDSPSVSTGVPTRNGDITTSLYSEYSTAIPFSNYTVTSLSGINSLQGFPQDINTNSYDSHTFELCSSLSDMTFASSSLPQHGTPVVSIPSSQMSPPPHTATLTSPTVPDSQLPSLIQDALLDYDFPNTSPKSLQPGRSSVSPTYCEEVQEPTFGEYCVVSTSTPEDPNSQPRNLKVWAGLHMSHAERRISSTFKSLLGYDLDTQYRARS
jgi:hypothetical protein